MAIKEKRPSSPTLKLEITAEQHDRAIQSNSGGCLIADAIKSQYPHLSSVSVDMATIRVTDRDKGYRYTYLTPAPAQHVLLSFDQGWPNPLEQLTVSRAVKITRIIERKIGPRSKAELSKRRKTRVEGLRARVDQGETLAPQERAQLTKDEAAIAEPSPPRERPASFGPTTVTDGGTIIGGRPLPEGVDHPNLLRGRNRHFGAKLADPGLAFNEAVEAEIARREKEARASN